MLDLLYAQAVCATRGSVTSTWASGLKRCVELLGQGCCCWGVGEPS
jgi:hypothetical protein